MTFSAFDHFPSLKRRWPVEIMEFNFFPRFCEWAWIKKVQQNIQKVVSPTGNRTPVSRVTGGDTYHYTIEDWQMQAVYRASGFSSAPMKWTKTVFGLEVVILVMCECDIYKHQLIRSDICENCSGPTEIRTRIAGFKVQSANHYTIGPDVLYTRLGRLWSQCAPNMNEIARIRIFIDKI